MNFNFFTASGRARVGVEIGFFHAFPVERGREMPEFPGENQPVF
jgi:hypothetical protein